MFSTPPALMVALVATPLQDYRVRRQSICHSPDAAARAEHDYGYILHRLAADGYGLADPALLAKDFPNLDLLDPKVPSTAELERRACEAEAAGIAVKGVSKSDGGSASAGIGGMVLVTSTGFHGSYLRSSQSISSAVMIPVVP